VPVSAIDYNFEESLYQMVIFTNNKAFKITSQEPLEGTFDHLIDLNEKSVHYENLIGKVLVKSVDFENIFKLIVYLQSNDLPLLGELTFIVKDKKVFKEALKETFIFVKAAGGIVKNTSGNLLFMKRLGKWDLPKGKAEKNESSKATALREVEEECGVTVKITDKLCTTWHTYPTKKGLVLKRTRWFKMDLVSDKNMAPQVEEDIEELYFMNENQVNKALENSYKTISTIIENYRNN
jgi:8-oxo-(d)GTP phosphatase